MTIYGIDAASYQHDVNWASVDKICDFGFEKVTEGTGYANPYWPAAKTAMRARAKATRFLPGCYLFMDFGEGATQADHFADKAGDLDGFALVVDLERAPNGSPTIAQAKACVARLRQRYPHHPIGGYAPHWYTGSADLRFFDYTWASRYVSGTGSPSSLYAKVPSSWWAAYGGKTPAILQFSSSATVAGVSGRVDISAFKGSLDQLRALALGKEEDMPFTADDKKWLTETLVPAVVKANWNTDAAKTPTGAPDAATNKTYAYVNVMRETYTLAAKILPLVTKIANQSPDIDEEALAAALLVQLAPDKIAALVAANLPADLAKQVADNLVSRLES